MDPSETFDFPDSLLNDAAKITLKDLLDSPFSQPWIVSALGNAAYMARHNKPSDNADVLLAAHVDYLVMSIPQSEKNELYRQCGRMVQERKHQHKERQAEAKSLIVERHS